MNSNNLIANIARLLLTEYIIINFNSNFVIVSLHDSSIIHKSSISRCGRFYDRKLDVNAVKNILSHPISLDTNFDYKLYIYKKDFDQIRKQLNDIKLNG